MADTTDTRSESEILFALCTSNDQADESAGFEQLTKYLFRWANNYSRSMPGVYAEDIVAEVIIEIWTRIKDGRGPEMPGAFLAWCRTITVRRAIDLHRRQKKEGMLPALPIEEYDEVIADTDHHAEADNLLHELVREIRGDLSSREAKLFDLIAFTDMTSGQAAEELGVSTSYLRVIRHRLFKKLRRNAKVKEMFSQYQKVKYG